MKKILLVLLLAITCSFISHSQVQLKFVTTNGYGNNLYLDNVTVGNQFNVDAAVGSINNINAGTSYATSTAPFIITPNVSVINIGKQNIVTSFTVTMTASPGGYTSTKTVASLTSGQSAEVIFDDLTITPSQGININVTVNLTGDENSLNNSLDQYTIYLPGTQRNILFEEWTSSTCGPCAANNPTIDAFIQSNFNTLVPVKYHMNWPAPGNDPMYLYNPTQATDRRNYYGVNAVPHAILDGIVNPEYPYSTPSSLPDAYDSRIDVGSPLSVTVTDTRVGDSIKADITIEILSNLEAGNYYLRVQAVERHIHYNTAPGTNGEMDFYDVFRRAYPSSLGTSIPTSAGTYNYSITYPLDMAVWVDSMIYTIAFVQNDDTKEVLNSGKGRDEVVESYFNNTYVLNVPKPEAANDIAVSNNPKTIVSQTDGINSVFSYELFEGGFPANGWSIENPDGGITFAQFEGANGPSIGGTKSVKMDFYSYSATGASDVLISKVFNGAEVTDSVKFNWAYAQYSSSYVDRLVVLLSVDGGATFPHTIFDASGSALATAPTTTNAFTPSSTQWGTLSYSLESILPVELTSFTATTSSNTVNLNWSTATEINNQGFEVQKKMGDNFIVLGFVNGKGSTTEAQQYSFSDKNLADGKYIYRLKQVDFNGTFNYSNQVEVDVNGPKSFALNQNYPNPFNPATKIDFSLAVTSKVTLKVYNLLGEEVASLINGTMVSGNHSINFNALDLNSGVYLYKLEAIGIDGTNFSDIKKMMLVK